MAVEVIISGLAGNTTIALPGNPTVQDVVNDERVTGYSSDKTVKLNNESVELTDYVEDGDIVSFASPDYKHGL